VVSGSNLPFFVALGTNAFAKYGVKVNWTPLSGTVAFTELGSNQVQIGVGSPAAIQANLKGAPVQLIGSLGYSYYELLAQPSVTSMKGAVGGSMGGSAPASTTDLAQRALAADDGITVGTAKNQINTVYFNGSLAASVTALSAGKTTIGLVEEPLIHTAQAANPSLHMIQNSFPTNVEVLTEPLAAVNSTWAAQNPKAVEGFIKGYLAGQATLTNDPAAAIPILVKYSKETTALITDDVKEQGSLDKFNPISQSDFNIYVDALKPFDTGIQNASYAKAVNNTYVQAASGS
jgi:ABC-type nitrate/sulfonate/bicarbonate transport system substrate-binding protein